MILGTTFFFLIMLLFYLFPPKKINSFYGYRTMASKKSIKHWEVANKVSSKLLLVVAGVMLVEGIVFSTYFDKNFEKITLMTLVIGLTITFFITERRIRRL